MRAKRRRRSGLRIQRVERLAVPQSRLETGTREKSSSKARIDPSKPVNFIPFEAPHESAFHHFESASEPVSPSLERKVRWLAYAGGLLAIGLVIFYATKWSQKAEPVGPASPVKSMNQEYAEVAAMFGDFLRSQTWEERMQHVRHPQRVGKLMRRYYETHPFTYPIVKSIIHRSGILLEGRRFLTMRFELADSRTAGIVAEQTEDGPKLDWESFVAYGTLDWETFLETKPQTLEQFRIYLSAVEEDPVLDREGYHRLYVEHRDSTQGIFGYVSESFPDWETLRRHLATGGQRPFIVSMTFDGDLLTIIKVHQNQWVLLDG